MAVKHMESPKDRMRLDRAVAAQSKVTRWRLTVLFERNITLTLAAEHSHLGSDKIRGVPATKVGNICSSCTPSKCTARRRLGRGEQFLRREQLLFESKAMRRKISDARIL
jgi:hypothetical protein